MNYTICFLHVCVDVLNNILIRMVLISSHKIGTRGTSGGLLERRRYRGEVVSIKKDSTLCCQRHRKYVLSAFNDYFILTGEFISGFHYRGLAAPRWPSICLSFYRGAVKVVRRTKGTERKKNEWKEGG